MAFRKFSLLVLVGSLVIGIGHAQTSSFPRPRIGVTPTGLLAFKQSFPPLTGSGFGNRLVTIPKFPPSLGQLDKVIFILRSQTWSRAGFESQMGAPITLNCAIGASARLVRHSDGAITPWLFGVGVSHNAFASHPFGVADGILDYAGISGFQLVLDSDLTTQWVLTNAWSAGFNLIGTGNLDVDLKTFATYGSPFGAFGPYGSDAWLDLPVHSEHLTVAYVYH